MQRQSYSTDNHIYFDLLTQSRWLDGALRMTHKES